MMRNYLSSENNFLIPRTPNTFSDSRSQQCKSPVDKTFNEGQNDHTCLDNTNIQEVLDKEHGPLKFALDVSKLNYTTTQNPQFKRKHPTAAFSGNGSLNTSQVNVT